MRAIGEAGYIVSQREFVFLASLTGAEKILGIKDDTYLMSEKDLIQEWEKAKVQLEAKKYISVELDNSVTVDRELFALVEACCEPKIFLRYTGRDKDAKDHSRSCYLSTKIAVELDKDRLMKDTYIVTPLVSIEKVAANFCECFEIEGNHPIDNGCIEMPKEEFERLSLLIDNNEKEKSLSLLKNYKCNHDVGEDLYKALNEKNLFKSLVILEVDLEDAHDIGRYTVIGGHEYLWNMEIQSIESGQIVKFSTCSPEEVVGEVEKLILALKEM